MRLVIAEKPSVARDIARVLGAGTRRDGYLEGNGLLVSWCFGHMAELSEPAHYDPAWKRWSLASLPMLPQRFEVKLRKGAKDQFAVLQRLLRSSHVEEVVNACDAGREGELIFRYVYDLAGSDKAVLRLWISSLTDSAIQTGWASLRPGVDFDRLADAARCRSESDWLVGLNATRALTCKVRDAGGDALLSVGRVQTPTLAMIVRRDREIADFVPQTFYRVVGQLVADVDEPPDRWEGVWFDHSLKEEQGAKKAAKGEVSKLERIERRVDAEGLAAALAGRTATVIKAQRRPKTEKPPLLYDLTALQRRANQRFGFPADRTLSLAQDLYEKHKLITYPRTDARYLTPDQVEGLPAVVRGLAPLAPYAPFCAEVLSRPIQPGKRVVNAAEVGDHHAILPTGRTPSSARLGPDEKRIFDLVARRLLAALSADAIFDMTELVVEVPDPGPLPDELPSPPRLRAKGRICRQIGWRAVDPPGKSKEVALPAVDKGDSVRLDAAEVKEGKTRPPRPHDDASLLRAMETAGRDLDDDALMRAMRGCGLGTPATRAAILTTLVDRKYITREKRALRATERGCSVIDALSVEALKSAELTGAWEGRLASIADAGGDRPQFMSDVAGFTREVVDAIRNGPAPDVGAEREALAVLGACPACGKPVREQRSVYGCDSGRQCSFVVFKKMSGRAISTRMVKALLKDGRSQPVKGFKSKKGKAFTAGLTWDAGRDRVGFFFVDEPRLVQQGDACPKCKEGQVIRGRTKLGCSRWRQGCGWTA